MIQLPNVTLICVATKDIPEARIALRKSCEGIQWESIKLLTSEPLVSDTWSEIQIESFLSVDDWCKFIFYDLHKYIETDFCMLIHPDGYVINPDKWDNRFLDYDYIGAPFLPNTIFDVYGNEVRVGNSVSIRSKRLLQLPSKLNLPWIQYNGSYNEDTQICAHYRSYFIGADMSFAPIEIAALFSHEIPIPETEGIVPFAFHEWEPAAPLFPIFSMDDIHTEYINLDSRTDREEHIQKELHKSGLKAIRRRGILPQEIIDVEPEYKWRVMFDRTKGAIGCHWSQVAVMEEALKQNKHAWVMEDDCIFCSDIQNRLQTIAEFCSTHDWDIIWLGGTYHLEPTWHKSIDGKHTHPDLQMCECTFNRDWEPTDNLNIVRTYGCWSTYSYIVNRERLPLILQRVCENVYRSMGIDWIMILLQPGLNTFAFNPGCVRQLDNQSNIGDGLTYFSGFSSLGDHWFKDAL